jgi:hypothetical protein
MAGMAKAALLVVVLMAFMACTQAAQGETGLAQGSMLYVSSGGSLYLITEVIAFGYTCDICSPTVDSFAKQRHNMRKHAMSLLVLCPCLYDAAAAATGWHKPRVQLKQPFYQSVAPVSEHATNPYEQGMHCVTKLTSLVLLLPPLFLTRVHCG